MLASKVRVAADGRIITVVLASDSVLLDSTVSAAIENGFFDAVMTVKVVRSGEPEVVAAPTTVAPAPTSTQAPVVPVKEPELRLTVANGRVVSLDGRVGSRVDTAALSRNVGPPNGWNLREDPATLAVPIGVVEKIGAAVGALGSGEISYSDANLFITGTMAPDGDLVALRELLDSQGEGFSTTYELSSDAEAVEEAIVEVTSLDGITFESGTANISVDGRLLLSEVGTLLIGDDGLLVTIAGHTDDVGDSLANLGLSLARAEAVMTFLIQTGVAPQALSAVGIGDAEPVADNSTPEGRAENRRIEFIVSRRGVTSP